MKKLLIAILLLPTLMFGQLKISDNFKVHAGYPYPVANANLKLYFPFGNNVIMVKHDWKTIIIQKYDITSGKIVFQKQNPSVYDLSSRESINKTSVEKVLQLKDHLYYCFARTNTESNIEQLLYKEINIETGDLGEEVLLFQVEGGVKGNHWYGQFIDRFYFQTSLDKTKVLIKYTKASGEKDDKNVIDEIGIHVFNENLEEAWFSTMKMPYNNNKMNNIQYHVNNTGVGYLFSVIYDSDKSKEFVKETKAYHLEAFSLDENGMNAIDVKDDNHYYSSVQLIDNAKGEVYLSGLYSDIENGKTDYLTKGFFSRKLDVATTQSTQYYPISTEIINQFISARQQKKGKTAISDLEFRDMHFMADGSILFTAEKFYSVNHTVSGNNGPRTVTEYHYKGILATKISSSGDLVWSKRLPKVQKGSYYKGELSYTYKEKNGKHYFFYVDHIENVNKSINDHITPYTDKGKGVYSAFIVNDEDGTIEKSPLVNFREVQIPGVKKLKKIYKFQTDKVVCTDNGVIFEFYKKGKEDTMLHVEIE